MQRVIGRKVYDTETAKHLWTRPKDMGHGSDDNSYMALYLSPNGQLFYVLTEQVGTEDEGTETLDVIDDGILDEIVSWLEETNAPVSVFEAAGIEVEAG